MVKQRKWIIGLLLFCWVLPYGVAHLCWQIREDQLEDNLYLRLQAAELEDLFHFVLTKAEAQRLFRWEHAREFSYQGRMFDVVRREEKGDTLKLWCYWDAEETSLKDQQGVLMRSAKQESIPLPILELLYGQQYIVPKGYTPMRGLSIISTLVSKQVDLSYHLWLPAPPERPPNLLS